ncbi:MAG TPA: TIR domain-containing protein [Thermomicrobiaceae bacterium]|nr:TIR domain-containing protein [Thermomicrobiaceae bacterium]
MREGMRNIPLFNQILEHFDNSKLPAPDFLRNTLEREPFNVTPEWSVEVAEIFTANGREVGFIRVISGSLYVIIESGPPTEPVELGAATSSDPIIETEVTAPYDMETEAISSLLIDRTANAQVVPSVSAPLPQLGPDSQSRPYADSTPPENRQFFIAHGWDKEALQQVQHILNQFRIPYVVAQDEPNAGRPISQKVRELMKSCSAGIYIFSADEEFKDKEGRTIWRPRENVVFELGAGSLEYGQRIVIFKEAGVYFPSDFRDIGYIEYDKGNLQAKAMDLLMELVALGAVRIAPAS